MLVTELPAHLLQPLPRSRVLHPVQTMAFVQLRVGTGSTNFRVEIAIAENVLSQRRLQVTRSTMGGWSRWRDSAVRGNAIDEMVAAIERHAARGYRCITDNPLLIPLNETDVRNLRRNSVGPRWALEYGSKFFDALYGWVDTNGEAAVSAVAASASAVSIPSTPTTVTSVSDALAAVDRAVREA